MAGKRSKKVICYRRPLNVNVGMVILSIIFIYLVLSVYTYLRQEKIQSYEVMDGGIVNNRIYNGLILHEEQVRTADRSDYINYCLREGKRTSVGSRVCSLGETGNLEALLKENVEEGTSPSDGSLSDLKKQLTSFVLSFQNQDFEAIYDTRISLDTSMMEYPSFSTLGRLDKPAEQSGAVFEQVHFDISGVISYGIGSFELMTTSDVDAADFDRSTYAGTVHKSGDLIGNGSPVYKIVISKKWSIVFPLNDEDAALYGDRTALRVVFRDYSLSIPAAYSAFTGGDGAAYGKPDFPEYMEQFISDRFVDFGIKVDKADGLRIPVGVITDKNFYLIPPEYMTQGGDSSEDGSCREAYTENDISIVLIPTTICCSDGEFYYMDMRKENGFKAGDYVVRPESSDRYQVGGTTSLKGVYNINKGYTIFKQIDILGSNSGYYIVHKSTKYGLSMYGHIVLDASMVEEGQLLHQ